MEEQKRAAIVVGLRAGRTAAEIAEFNKLPESLCYRVKKKLDESVAAGEDPDDISVDRKTHKRRRDAIRTPEFIEQLQNMIDEDPSKSIHVMDTVVKPWMEGIAGDRHYVFQQDGAPAHNANKTQAWLADNLKEFWPKNIWPPSSPDCNPCDFFLWGVCEREVNKRPHNTKASLKTKITQVMAGLDKDMVANACRRFRSRIERVVDADGGFIE